MKKPRIPLPKKVEKVHRDERRYYRPRDKRVSMEWLVECEHCGTFTAVQNTDPAICPRCYSPDIETSSL